MNRKTVLALVGAISIAGVSSGAALAASTAGPAVSVEIKTPTKTLVSAIVHGEKGWITKSGTPAGVCPGRSAAGALDAATQGRWKAKYYSKYKDLLVTSILGVKPENPGYWSIIVNGKAASVGACDVRLKAGQKLLFREIK